MPTAVKHQGRWWCGFHFHFCCFAISKEQKLYFTIQTITAFNRNAKKAFNLWKRWRILSLYVGKFWLRCVFRDLPRGFAGDFRIHIFFEECIGFDIFWSIFILALCVCSSEWSVQLHHGWHTKIHRWRFYFEDEGNANKQDIKRNFLLKKNMWVYRNENN